MLRVLQGAGFTVRGWNRSPLAEEALEGIALAADLEEAARADVLLLMLSDSPAVDAVLKRLEPLLSPGQVVLDMGSSDPRRSEAHAARLQGEGIGWVDAPVSGGPEGAKTGTLAIMAGATPDDFARVQPVLDALGGNVVHVGEPGAGHKTKVVNQIIVGLTIQAVAEALALAEASGVDPKKVQEALKGGFADSKILQLHGTRMIARSYQPGAKVKTQLKDLRLGLELAAPLDLDLPHVRSAAQRYERLEAEGDGELDHSALHKLLVTPEKRGESC
jgi:3-hydroxyisobutyrate dehydrogenase-like beta-hydroxyacid dehydrogenase